jgi:hypothetical protein
MNAGHDLERRLAIELPRELDAVTGPHPVWATSPAAARISDRRGGIRWPGRLLAIAAVLAVAGGVALVVGLRRDAVGGCPTLANYAAASTTPTLPPGVVAPDVSFPPVAPTATMTTGMLRPGDWAVIANADGPGIQMRVRDVRRCGRLPDLRASESGSIYLATVDARALRSLTGLVWLGVGNLVEGSVGAGPGGFLDSPGYDMPGLDHRSRVEVPAGFAASSVIVLDVPETDKLITLDHPTENTMTLPGLEPTRLGWPRMRWVVRDGDPTGGGYSREPEVAPGATATIGEVRVGEQVTVMTSDGAAVMRLSGIDTVPAYPGLSPATGHVFVEVLVTVLPGSRTGTRWNDWHAVGPDGELSIIYDAYGADQRRGVLPNLLSEVPSNDGWIVIEAPEEGPIRLEYREYGSADAVFWLRLRD